MTCQLPVLVRVGQHEVDAARFGLDEQPALGQDQLAMPVAPSLPATLAGLRIEADENAVVQTIDVALVIDRVGELRIQINDGLWQSIGSHPLFDTVVVPVDLRSGANRIRITVLCPGLASGYSGFAWGSWVFALRGIMANGQEIPARLPNR